MKDSTRTLNETIRDHNKDFVNRGDTVHSADLYADYMHYDNKENKTTYPWDENWEDLSVSDETKATQKDQDEYINDQVVFPNSDGVEVLCRVKGRKYNTGGSIIDNYNSNPIIDTRIFDVEYPDGRIDAFTTNVIVESIYAQVDDQGFTRDSPGLGGTFCDIGGYNFYFLWIDIKTYKNMSE